MRRYVVAIDGQAFTVDVAETASDAFEVTVDGRRYAATLIGDRDLPGVAISAEPGPWTAEPATGNGATPTPEAAPPTAQAAQGVQPTSSPRPASRPMRPPARSAAGLLTAPMPGAILEVSVAPGAVVRRGDPLLVLEAMKMRNVIRAPRDATIGEVHVEAGAQVASGDPLVRFGPPPA